MDAGGGEAACECWLCSYSGSEVAQSVSATICDNSQGMCIEAMASQASALIREEVTNRYGPDANLEGTSPAAVQRHIKQHMLHANVALAVTLRGLLELSDELRRQIHTVDEETGQRIIDVAQVKNYLALTNQVAGLYKLGDGSKLLFSRSGAEKKEQ